MFELHHLYFHCLQIQALTEIINRALVLSVTMKRDVRKLLLLKLFDAKRGTSAESGANIKKIRIL